MYRLRLGACQAIRDLVDTALSILLCKKAHTLRVTTLEHL